MAITDREHPSWELRVVGFQIRATPEAVGHKAKPTKATCGHLLTRDAQGTGCVRKWALESNGLNLNPHVGMLVQSSSTAVENEHSHLCPELRC